MQNNLKQLGTKLQTLSSQSKEVVAKTIILLKTKTTLDFYYDYYSSHFYNKTKFRQGDEAKIYDINYYPFEQLFDCFIFDYTTDSDTKHYSLFEEELIKLIKKDFLLKNFK